MSMKPQDLVVSVQETKVSWLFSKPKPTCIRNLRYKTVEINLCNRVHIRSLVSADHTPSALKAAWGQETIAEGLKFTSFSKLLQLILKPNGCFHLQVV